MTESAILIFEYDCQLQLGFGQRFGGPKNKQHGVPGFGPEMHFYVMGEFVRKCVFAVVKGMRQLRFPLNRT